MSRNRVEDSLLWCDMEDVAGINTTKQDMIVSQLYKLQAVKSMCLVLVVFSRRHTTKAAVLIYKSTVT